MRNLTATEIVLGIFYITASLSLIIAAYMLYIRRFKRNKLVAMNTISLVTSKENIFSSPTKFLLIMPTPGHVKIELLNQEEKVVSTLIDEEIAQEEYPIEFDPVLYDSGKYYIYLTTDNAKILRGITITR